MCRCKTSVPEPCSNDLLNRMCAVLDEKNISTTIFQIEYNSFVKKYVPLLLETETDQINAMNAFWRKKLMPHNESTYIREWLNDGNSIDAYVKAFSAHWLPLVVNLGII